MLFSLAGSPLLYLPDELLFSAQGPTEMASAFIVFPEYLPPPTPTKQKNLLSIQCFHRSTHMFKLSRLNFTCTVTSQLCFLFPPRDSEVPSSEDNAVHL